MKPFVLDLWHDLRTKRLAPVAALLAAALVAVPVLMLKPVSEPAPAPAPAKKADAAAQLPQLKSIGAVAQTAAARGGSTLSAFKSKDPFKPPAVVLNAKREQTTATAAAPKTAAADAGGGSGSAGGDTGAQGGSRGGTTNPPSSTAPSPPVTRAFVYMADVRFGRSGRRLGRYSALRKLESLPNESSPLLIFLGVTDDGDDAVFLVDSTLKGTGEGRCSPSGSSCATLTIGAGAEHEFVDPDGKSYTLLVDEIRKIEQGKASASAARRARARSSVGAGSPARRFVPPVLADLLTVSTDGGDTSSAGRDRR